VPIYEYVCQSCQHRFEVRQKVSDPPVSSCVRCGKAVTKVISPSAILFKGSGWYVTDYSDKLKPPAQSESAEKPADGQKAQKEAATAPSGQAAVPTATGSSGSTAGAGSGSESAPATPATPSSSSSSSKVS